MSLTVNRSTGIRPAIQLSIWMLFIIGAGLFFGGCGKKEQKFAIAFSNDMIGEIRSCGCASKDYGGLGRRGSFVNNTRKTRDNLLLVDAGDFFGVDVNYGKEKASLTLQSMSVMRYDGIVPGEKDFVFGADYLLERTRTLKLPIIAANIYAGASDSLLFQPSRRVELPNGLQVGLIGLSSYVVVPGDAAAGVRFEDPMTALNREIPKLSDTDIIVVLAHMPIEKARALAQKRSDIDIIVTGHKGKPIRRLRPIGGTYVLQAEEKARYMGLASATLVNGQIESLTGFYEPLSIDYEDHPAIVKLFQAYDIDIANQEKALGSGTVPSAEHAKRSFVGGKTCQPCHAEIQTHWATTKHAHAFDILTSRHRELDRDCTPCHTTGFYEIGGFLSTVNTPDLIHVQCESCHGNGSQHSKNPSVKTAASAAASCVQCHTKDQTPDFSFASYWKRIQHPKTGSARGGQ